MLIQEQLNKLFLLEKQKHQNEANTRVIIYYMLEQSKEITLEFSKGTTKVL